MTTERKHCPACFQPKEGFTGAVGPHNSMSRYVDEYICSDCGTREAFEGFFWKDTCPAPFIRKAAKRRGVTVQTLLTMSLAAFAFLAPAKPASAGYAFVWNGVRTYCSHSAQSTYCYTTGAGTGNTAKVIDVPEVNPAPKEPEMTEAERAARHRESCKSRSMVCLEEPSW
jgi:hypothetical protein